MPRYEFSDGKSSKFWEIDVDGDSFTVRYGRIGTDGQASTKTFANAQKAQDEAEKLTRSKTKKGYVLVAGSSSAPAPTASAATGNPQLEQAIFDRPDDTESWSVYGDWLQQQGDPRGELIGLEVAIASGKKDAKALRKKRDALLAQHEDEWIGETLRKAKEAGKDLDNEPGFAAKLSWRYGYLHAAHLRTDYDYDGPDVGKMLRALLKLESSKFLAELYLGLTDAEGETEYDSLLLALSKVGKLQSLRKLHVGAFEFPDETEISWTSVGNVGRIWNVMPNLEWLKVQGGSIELGNVKHDKLRELYVHTGGLPKAAVKSLAKADLPNAETLEIWLGTEDYGGEGDIDALRPILASKTLPKVKHLGLMNSDFENDIAIACCMAPIVAQLDTLDLSMGTMTDDGARALVEHADHFKHLKRLNVDQNFISDEAAGALRSALGEIVDIGTQEDASDWLYVSVGE